MDEHEALDGLKKDFDRKHRRGKAALLLLKEVLKVPISDATIIGNENCDGWVCVLDALPPDDTDVLVHLFYLPHLGGRSRFEVAKYDNSERLWWGGPECSSVQRFGHLVTHWRPISFEPPYISESLHGKLVENLIVEIELPGDANA